MWVQILWWLLGTGVGSLWVWETKAIQAFQPCYHTPTSEIYSVINSAHSEGKEGNEWRTWIILSSWAAPGIGNCTGMLLAVHGPSPTSAVAVRLRLLLSAPILLLLPKYNPKSLERKTWSLFPSWAVCQVSGVNLTRNERGNACRSGALN